VAVIVGRRLTDVDPPSARDAVLGYAAFNDLTSRRAQKLTHSAPTTNAIAAGRSALWSRLTRSAISRRDCGCRRA
jgi:2-keto-4-pentenoate hydratase/2-oxohepta-3-ene-1,7-dioic acid hydratase in catechol pathway